jgi:hypothetical protein
MNCESKTIEEPPHMEANPMAIQALNEVDGVKLDFQARQSYARALGNIEARAAIRNRRDR